MVSTVDHSVLSSGEDMHDELKNKDGLDMDFLKKVDPDLFG